VGFTKTVARAAADKKAKFHKVAFFVAPNMHFFGKIIKKSVNVVGGAYTV